MRRISRRPVGSGIPMSTSRSKRPNRRRAGSIELGRLVAAITTTFDRALRPSISVNSCDTTRRSTSPLVYQYVSDIKGKRSAKADLFTFGRNGVDFVNENDRRRILFSLFERLSKVALRLAGHFGHDFGTVDEEEECAGFICHGAGHECFSRTRRTKHKNATRRLDSDRFKELRMA